MFQIYPKIYRLGKEETEGILDVKVYIQEKIDGANFQIWLDKNGEMHFGTRNNEINEGFRGAIDYCREHSGIKALLEKLNSETITEEGTIVHLYGEWLCPHTIKYNPESYGHFYLYDIVYSNSEHKTWVDTLDVAKYAEEFNIKFPFLFGYGKFTEEEIRAFVGQSKIGERGEGVVIKTNLFENKFSDGAVYAKLVTESFIEDNSVVFGGNSKYSELYWEQYISNKYMTLSRVKKIVQKTETVLERPLTKADTARVSSTAYHDLITEEIWEIQKNVPEIKFKALKRICIKKAVFLFHDLLDGFNSVAYEESTGDNTEDEGDDSN